MLLFSCAACNSCNWFYSYCMRCDCILLVSYTSCTMDCVCYSSFSTVSNELRSLTFCYATFFCSYISSSFISSNYAIRVRFSSILAFAYYYSKSNSRSFFFRLSCTLCNVRSKVSRSRTNWLCFTSYYFASSSTFSNRREFSFDNICCVLSLTLHATRSWSISCYRLAHITFQYYANSLTVPTWCVTWASAWFDWFDHNFNFNNTYYYSYFELYISFVYVTCCLSKSFFTSTLTALLVLLAALPFF